MSRIMVFEQETTEENVDVLIPIEVPEGIGLKSVGEWLAGLHGYANRHYTVMVVSEVYDFQIKKRPQVLYAESVEK